MIRVQAVVTGAVQGVGFRWATRREAARLAVAGFVRNRPDGSVEVEVEGAPDAVGQLVRWLEKGPPAAQVRRVQVDGRPPQGTTGFEVVEDA